MGVFNMTSVDRTKPLLKRNPDSRVASISGAYVRWASWIVVVVSVIVMAGWIFNIAAIRNIIPGTAAMKFNAALGFLCGSLSLLILQRKKFQLRESKIGGALVVLIMLIGLLTVSEYIFGWDLRIDQLFVRDLGTSAGAPGRMAFITALCFILWGLALISIKSTVSQYLSSGILFLSMLALIGYVFDYRSLYRLMGFESISFLSAVIFFTMSFATLFAKPQLGIMKIATSNKAGGRAVRLFLPLAILLVAFLGWLVIRGEHLRVFDFTNGVTVLLVLVIIIYSLLLFLHADKMNKAEDELTYFRFHDALTGLFNQSYFQEEVSRLERGREFPVSILMAGVDNFKMVNDQYGRAIGDLLLIQTAQALSTAFRANDVIARISADEFAVLLPATNHTTAESLLQRVRQLIAESNKANPIVTISLSLGIDTAVHPVQLIGVLKKAGENLHRDKFKRVKPVGK